MKISKSELIEMTKNPDGKNLGLNFTWGKGLITLLFKGSWDKEKSYTWLDLVEYQNKVYVSVSKNKGIEPDKIEYRAWLDFDAFYEAFIER